MSNDDRGRIVGSGLPLASRLQSHQSTSGNRLVPRPEHQRRKNEYVDTPFQHKVQSRRTAFLPRQDTAAVHSSTRLSVARPTPVPCKPSTTDASLQKQKVSVISTQPTTFTKELLEEDSIICGRCGRCRCEACGTPRKPGGFWMCGGKCLCSPSRAVDYASCLFCVRCVMYHCGSDTDVDDPAVDRPCSCVGPNTFMRWACMTLAAIPLPCLLCYWPLEGTRRLCEGTYRRFSTQGCKCQPVGPTTPQPPQPEKSLLQDCV